MPLTYAVEAVPDEVDQQRQQFVEAAEQVLPERTGVVEAFDELVAKFNDHWGWFHRNLWNRDAYEEEKQALDRVRSELEERQFPEETGGGSILDVAQRMIEHHTPVVSLFIIGMGWVKDSLEPTSEVYARTFTPADQRNLADWDDQAREAYNAIIEQQQNATEAAKDVASFMSSWLAGIADDNVGYATFLLERLAEITKKIVAGIAALVDSWGVFTLLEIAELVGEVVGQAIEILGEIARRISSALERVIEAEAVLDDHSFFPGGKWPEAVDRA